MANFEGKDRREATLKKVLPEYGFKNLDEARELCLSKGIDVDAIVKGIQPIAFDNASWAYTLGCAIAIKKGIKNAADAIELLKTNPQEYTKEQLDIFNKLKKKFNISDIKDIENVDRIKKFKNTYNVKNLTELEHAKSFKIVTKMLDMAPDVFIFGVAKAMLTVTLIPPILKYVFGIEKKAKAPQQVPAQNNTVPNTLKPEITKFVGGLK